MVHFSPSIEQLCNSEANNLGGMWSRIIHRHLLTNRLHGKAAELCLANS